MKEPTSDPDDDTPSRGGAARGPTTQADAPPRTRSSRRSIIAGVTALIVVLAGAFVWYVLDQHAEKTMRTEALASEMIRETRAAFDSVRALAGTEVGALRTHRNAEHVEAAQKYGIPGIRSRSDARELTLDGKLVRVQSNPLYRVEELDYSIPYLTSSAANLLDRIGNRFQEELQRTGLPPYRFVVTSVTRSQEDQRKLRRINVNAAANSSHEFGTTFDLHYQDFDYKARPDIPDSADVYEEDLNEMLADAYTELAREQSIALKAVLGRVLLDLQREGDAMAIYERRQPVFHVTASELIPPAAPNTPREAGPAGEPLHTAP